MKHPCHIGEGADLYGVSARKGRGEYRNSTIGIKASYVEGTTLIVSGTAIDSNRMETDTSPLAENARFIVSE